MACKYNKKDLKYQVTKGRFPFWTPEQSTRFSTSSSPKKCSQYLLLWPLCQPHGPDSGSEFTPRRIGSAPAEHECHLLGSSPPCISGFLVTILHPQRRCYPAMAASSDWLEPHAFNLAVSVASCPIEEEESFYLRMNKTFLPKKKKKAAPKRKNRVIFLLSWWKCRLRRLNELMSQAWLISLHYLNLDNVSKPTIPPIIFDSHWVYFEIWSPKWHKQWKHSNLRGKQDVINPSTINGAENELG